MAEQTLTGFLISKATQSRKEAKKQDRKGKRKKKGTEKESDIKQGIGAKLSGGLSAISSIFSGKGVNDSETATRKPRSSGNSTGLAKILSSGFGSLTADNIQLSSGLASITQLLNSSYKAQSFTATGVQTIAAILSDQLENQSSILSTVKSLKSGGGSGGSGGGSRPKATPGSAIGGNTLTGAVVEKFGDKIKEFLVRGGSKGLESIKNLFNGGKPKVTASGGGSAPRAKPTTQFTKPIGPQPVNSASPWAKGAAGEAANAAGHVPRLPSAPIKPPASTGMMGRLGNMFNSAKGAVGGAFKGIQSKVGAAVAEKVGSKLASKGALAGARAIPIAQQVLGIGLATKELMDGDIAGAGLALGSALPGPFGWGFLAADLGREIVGPELVDKSFGQALGGNLGLSDAKIQQRESTMSATERAVTTMSGPSFTGWASGGMTFGKGVGNVMVGEAAGGSKGEAVVPLSSGAGKKMLGGENSSMDPGMQFAGAATLSVVDNSIKGMGQLGGPVAAALGPNIQQLATKFGVAQTLPNLRIGGAKFKEDGNAKKKKDQFLEGLLSESFKALDTKKKKDDVNPATPPKPANVLTTPDKEGNPNGGSPNNGSGDPMDQPYKHRVQAPNGSLQPKLTKEQGEKLKLNERATKQVYLDLPETWKDKKTDWGDKRILFDSANGKIEVWHKAGGMRYELSVPGEGGQNAEMSAAAFNEVRNYLRVNDPEFGSKIGYISPSEYKVIIQKRNDARVNGNQSRGGDFKTPTMPRTSASMAPVGATNIANSQTNSVSIINIMGGSSGGGSIPVSSSPMQDSSQYISDPFPKGLAGVLCTSPWSVV